MAKNRKKAVKAVLGRQQKDVRGAKLARGAVVEIAASAPALKQQGDK